MAYYLGALKEENLALMMVKHLEEEREMLKEVETERLKEMLKALVLVVVSAEALDLGLALVLVPVLGVVLEHESAVVSIDGKLVAVWVYSLG
jgi:hypothetical protein